MYAQDLNRPARAAKTAGSSGKECRMRRQSLRILPWVAACLFVSGGASAQTTNKYRSIGTRVNYGTTGPEGGPGFTVATNGSAIVTGTVGTDWVAANRGRGDCIQIAGTNYVILKVDSPTQLTLTTPFAGPDGSGKTYSISRQYQNLTAWETCVDGGPCTCSLPAPTSSLVFDDRREFGIAYKDTPFVLTTANVIIFGSTTDPLHGITLTADGVNRHNGTPNTGVIVDSNLDPNGWLLRIRDSNVTVEWLELRGRRCTSTTCSNEGLILVNGTTLTPSTNILLQNLLIHDFYEPTLCPTPPCPPNPQRVDAYGIALGGLEGKSVTVRNSMIWDGDRDAIRGDRALDTLVVENCSIDNMQDSVGGGGRGVYAEDTLSVTVRNTISTNNPNGDFAVDLGSLTGSNNTSSDTTAATYFPAGNPHQASAASMFVLPNSNLHLLPSLVVGPNSPLNSGSNLSPSFWSDIDGQSRLGLAWDRGADERDATTAVELVSFTARGGDGEVVLEWETGSELNNLGFHVYRALSEEGPYERSTISVIPGLGSSPEGARYRYVDSGLTNGVTYFYKLEDIETTGNTERHGPVSATPEAGAETPEGGSSPSPSTPESSPASITYGDPSAVSFRVLSSSPRQMLLELETGGFYAEPQSDGTVRLSIPDFIEESEAGSPALPVKRAWVEALAGLRLRVASVEDSEVVAFSGLRPSAADSVAVVASRSGTARVGRRRQSEGAGFRGAGLYPEEAARIVSVAFQGELKKVFLELAPLRWDRASGQLLLARRLMVRLVYSGREAGERSLGGARGRRYRESPSYPSRSRRARLLVREKGLYRVSFEEVFGLRGRVLQASSLRLSRQGKPVAFHLEPNRSWFGPGGALYFPSEGAVLNPYGQAAVYELELAEGGSRMPVVSAAPSGAAVAFYWQKLSREENRYYQAGLLDAPDLWLWDLLFAPATKSFPLELRELASAATEPGLLELWLQGVSDFEANPDHHVRVFVNGSLVGEESWDGKEPRQLRLELPPGLLREGENQLALENVGDTGAAYSMVMLDRFELSYPRLLVAEAGKLEGSFSESGEAGVSGLSSAAHLLDVSEEPASWLSGADSSSGSLRFRAEGGRSYLAVSSDAVRPAEVQQVPASTLRNRRQRADYLVVAPRAFLEVAQPLLDWRRAEGLSVRAVPLEEVYSEFGFGESRPEAIQEFLAYAYHHWQAPSPRYVLLLGDGTYDFKNYLGTGVLNQVPPLMVKTTYLWTASDPTYGAVNGEDLLPDVAIGRLPAATVDEARVMVEKILAYERAGPGLAGPSVVVADNPDEAGDFEADAEEIASSLLASRNPRKIYLGQLGRDATRSAIVETFDQGASLLSYIGHGAIHLWAQENLFQIGQVPALLPQSRQPLVLTLNCLNGYFHFPYYNALGEELLKAEGKGALAAFSPSGLSLNEPAHRFHKALLGELLLQDHARLGDAVVAAQAAYAETGAFPELLSIYHLMGDPALNLR